MNIEEVREYCLSLKNTIECFPFDEVSLVFKVENKMFLLLPLDAEEPHVSLKCSTDYVEELREHYTAVEPAYHFNKKYWNSIYLDRDMEDEEIMMSTDNESPRILRVVETASTNSLLRELVIKESLAEGSVVVADFQTAGRGQIGNTWESEAGKNLMFSLVLYPTCIPANRQFLISQIAALSVKEALDLYADHITVKWPNDIYWKDKKICGMLIENDLSGHNLYCSIIGIGINLNQTVFRGDAPNPVSLFQIIGKEVDREEVLHRFLSIFYRYYLSLLQEEHEDIRARYQSALYRREGYHGYKDESGEFEACIHDIESTGHLLLALRDGSIRRYAFKEVSYCK